MRAKPIYSLSLLAAALALPGTAFPLGLGKLTVNSGLGQPLSAQIELTAATKEELDSLAARVADAALYRQNNLAYQSVLTRSRVTIERAPNGEAFLKVTTAGSVGEPYLDLLVEVNWASGRVVRAYTFLLDPPGVAAAAPAVEPVAPLRSGAPAPRAAAPAAASAARPAAEPSAGGPGTYTVRRGDTLSRIAGENKPPSATLEQMLVALFKSNESAFDGDNMNRLRAGAIVTIPRAEEVGATPPTEAAKIVQVQAADWRAYRDRLAGAAPAAEGAGARAAAGKISTAVEEKAPAVVPGRDQLKVSREALPAKGVTAGAGEEVIARDKALKEAQTRIADLEKTLNDLQRAIELKSQTAAQLQAQADAAKGKAPEAPKVAPLPAPVPEAARPAEPPKAAEAPKMAEPEKAPEPKAAPAAPPPPPKAEAPKPAPAVAPKPSFFDDFFATTPMWAIGGGALLSLAGIAAIIAARRRKATKFEDSIISGTDIKTNTVFGSTGGGVVNTGDNSLTSEFSREGLGSIDTDEVDPIAEAEVYLAYGRDAQAEEILKDALKKDSQRQEIYLKLLEIHAQHNKPSAFETIAGELYSVSQGKGEIWQKAVGLGRQLDPNNPMFGEAGVPPLPTGLAAGAGVVATTAPAAVGVITKAATPDAQPATGATVPVDVASDMGAEPGLDFRLDEDISVAPTSGVKPKTPQDILAGAESEVEKSTRSASASLSAAFEGASAAAPASNLDFHLDQSERPAPFQRSQPRESASDEPATPAPALARPQAAIELDKLDLSFESERTTFEDPTPSVLDGQWHDAATKLDLAKAYQEMGDVEGAREILQEVMHEGDDEQKTEAQSLLSRLG